ncbi:hypothetical protein PILCRDRAFT_84114 [Piloderma croceum F 1598]|uniref:DUF2423 domain-containing protein n=1 Tax=Piloderma croceum (strain F 1598) TaxID=765440 RepID=A0A0C3BWX5_PILCF|nr:hypothetical protein PILCRDRAFT_84114 [Piloderma croceum F 1598]
MAKSMRSKVKRSFRSKKRETGVYAATEAARLHRLNQKLVATSTRDKDGDVPVEEAEEEANNILGWSWLPIFGLLDHDKVTAESMEAMMQCSPAQPGRDRDLVVYLGEHGRGLFDCLSDRGILKELNRS